MKRKLILLLAAICMLSPPAMASIIYGDYLGGPGEVDFIGVEEDSVTDPLPLFEAPTRIGNSLLFFPTTFASYSDPNSADTTSGTLKMIINADQGDWLTTIVVSEVGDFSLLGPDAQASVAGALTITDLVHGTVLFDSLAVIPGVNGIFSTMNGDTNGIWTATTTIQLPSADDVANRTNSIMVLFNNTLQTATGDDSTAFVQKKSVRQSVTIEVPEPTTLALLAMGSVILMRRKK